MRQASRHASPAGRSNPPTARADGAKALKFALELFARLGIVLKKVQGSFEMATRHRGHTRKLSRNIRGNLDGAAEHHRPKTSSMVSPAPPRAK